MRIQPRGLLIGRDGSVEVTGLITLLGNLELVLEFGVWSLGDNLGDCECRAVRLRGELGVCAAGDDADDG